MPRMGAVRWSKPSQTMTLVQQIFQSSLGRKYVAALTGAGLFVFLIGHLAGNLQVFGPPDLINGYAHFLKSKPLMVWAARLGLLASDPKTKTPTGHPFLDTGRGFLKNPSSEVS